MNAFDDIPLTPRETLIQEILARNSVRESKFHDEVSKAMEATRLHKEKFGDVEAIGEMLRRDDEERARLLAGLEPQPDFGESLADQMERHTKELEEAVRLRNEQEDAWRSTVLDLLRSIDSNISRIAEKLGA